MAFTVDITGDNLFAVVRAVWLQILPTNTEVVKLQESLVAEPIGDLWVGMNDNFRMRLATNEDLWDFTDPAPTNLAAMTRVQVTIDCDVHGKQSADYAQIFETIWRDAWAVDFVTSFCANHTPDPIPIGIAPLFAEDAKQTPFINAEQAYEDRWTVGAVLQANVTSTFIQQYMNQAKVGLINVDASYPP